jgi:hypothetical protein
MNYIFWPATINGSDYDIWPKTQRSLKTRYNLKKNPTQRLHRLSTGSTKQPITQPDIWTDLIERDDLTFEQI